tara:strand:- start:137 stop:451 length:315 start_codon:yes stop_codon:yes gene_type:complete
MPTNYRILLQTIKENSVGALADIEELSDVYRLVEHDVVDMEIRCEKTFLDFFCEKVRPGVYAKCKTNRNRHNARSAPLHMCDACDNGKSVMAWHHLAALKLFRN